MTITFNDIKAAVKRHLAVIGKRTYSKDGENRFSTITLSSAEEPILEAFVSTALQNVQASLAQLIVSYSESTTQVTMVVRNTRERSDFDATCSRMIKSYITFFVLSEYLGMIGADMAEKYSRDAIAMMETLIAAIYHKNPPK